MKKAILLPVFLCAFFSVTNAQINLNKVKNKATKTVKTKKEETKKETTDSRENTQITKPSSSGSTSSTSSASSEPMSDSDREKAAIRTSPAKDILWDLRSDLKLLESRVGQYNFNDKLEQVQTRLKQVEQTDPSFEYLKQYKERAAKAEMRNECRDISDRLQSELSWMTTEIEAFYKNLHRYDRRVFDSLSEKYDYLVENGQNGSYIDNMYAKVVAFYSNEAENAPIIMERFNDAHGDSEGWIKTERVKPEYIGRKNSQRMIAGFKEDLRSVDYALGVFKTAKSIYPNNAQISAHYNKLTAIQKDLLQYESSGELERDLEKVKERELEEMRMSKPEISSSDIDAFVKQKIGVRTAEIQIKRVVIRTDWYIKKATTGIPLYKGVEVEVAYSYQGKCYFTMGVVLKNHQGGGRYSGLTLDNDLSTFTNYDKGVGIKCENIFK